VAIEIWFVSSIIGLVAFLMFTAAAYSDRSIAAETGISRQETYAFWQMLAGVLFSITFFVFTIVGHLALTDDRPDEDSDSGLAYMLSGGNVLWTLGGILIWFARYRAVGTARRAAVEEVALTLQDVKAVVEDTNAVVHETLKPTNGNGNGKPIQRLEE